MPFLISIPDRLSSPSSAVKVNGRPVPSSPSTTPLTAIGTSSQMISGWRSALNSRIEISTMISRLTGSCRPRLWFASAEFSCSPPQAIA